MKFKVGDTVERINGEHAGMFPGNRDTIIKIRAHYGIYLRKYNFDGDHTPSNFKLIHRANDKMQKLKEKMLE